MCSLFFFGHEIKEMFKIKVMKLLVTYYPSENTATNYTKYQPVHRTEDQKIRLQITLHTIRYIETNIRKYGYKLH